MSSGELSALQVRILGLLAEVQPEWTLTGGAALIAAYLKHRTTRDLDLFWREQGQLGALPAEVRERLVATGFEVTTVQSVQTFARLRVSDGHEVCLVDLVAEPQPPIEAPTRISIGGATITVDTAHEILVSKLCALLGRSELRDLEDVRALLAAGGDFDAALLDAPKKDGGFSPLTLSWVLERLNVRALARAEGWRLEDADDIDGFRQELIQRLLASSSPG